MSLYRGCIMSPYRDGKQIIFSVEVSNIKVHIYEGNIYCRGSRISPYRCEEGVEFPGIELFPVLRQNSISYCFHQGSWPLNGVSLFCNIFVRDKTKFLIEKCQIIGKGSIWLMFPLLCGKKIVEVKGADDTPPRISPNFKLAAEANLKI